MHVFVRRIVQHVSLVFAALLSASASAEYVVNRVDYVDRDTGAIANYTSLLGANNGGQVVGFASFDNAATGFSFVYDPVSGNYLRLPLPPGFDGIERSVGATGINDAGVIAGSTFETAEDGSIRTRGFILANGTYTFFSHPAWANTSGRTISDAAPQFPQGFVVGFVDDGLLETNESSAGFVYDVARSAFATLDGTTGLFTIAHGQNAAGQVTGSVFEFDEITFRIRQSGFVFTPSVASNPFSGGTTNRFQINAVRTLARGITSSGTIVAATRDGGTLITRTHVGTMNAFQQINVPGSTGGGCFDIPPFSPTGAFPEHIKDSGQISGQLTDNACTNHGLILTPATLPSGTASDGAAAFTVDVTADKPVFINLPVALAYDYAIGKHDPRFATVRLPLGIGNNKFVLVVGHRAFAVNAGQLFDFRANGHKKGVKAFRVACVDPAALQDPVNSAAFPTELSFMQAGSFTGTQRPLATPTGDEHGPSSDPTLSQAECRDLLLGRPDAGGPAAD